MAFMDLAKSRYSVRKFSDKPIEKEKLDAILEAGALLRRGITTSLIGCMCCRARKHWRRSGG